MTFLHQIFIVLTYGGIAQGIFVVLLLNHKSVKRSRANLFLSILIIALTFSITHILYAGRLLNHLAASIYPIGDPTFLLIAPLLWFYILELTGHKPRGSRLFLHFIPFFIVIFLSLTLQNITRGSFLDFVHKHYRTSSVLFWIMVFTQFSWYQYKIHKQWQGYQQLIHQEVSNTEDVNISWVRFFMTIFLFINILFFIGLFAAIHFNTNGWLPRITALVFSLSVYALGYKGILQREIFDTHTVDAQQKSLSSTSTVEIRKSDRQLIDRILEYMTERRPYLDAELTLSKLAQEVGISRSQLSQLINDGLGDNFYDFVNKYRVEEVKKLMTDPKMQNYNMLGIALEAGFKSKSTFNLIFKRFTGLTPTEYRKNLQS